MLRQKIENILNLIGSTPLVKLNALIPNSVNIYAKLEGFNPGGSIKDRIALSMIEDAEKDGRLKRGMTIIEPTSGNTALSLAMVGAIKKYRVILVMDESMGAARRQILQSFGAEIELIKAEKGMYKVMARAKEMAESSSDYFMPDQFNNPANPEVHRRSTAKEILKGMKQNRIDAFIAGVGTGGTISGIGEVLKSKNKNIKIVAVEPQNSAVLSGKDPGPHRIPGIGAGFIPQVLNTKIIDEVIAISDKTAYNMVDYLAAKEGILAGVSSGAVCAAALKFATKLEKGKNIVLIFADGRERHPGIDR